ncbi:protein phosphatase 1 regulatory subunit 16A-like [Uloborus diversus]|uniref:protein phosphatase 1 regulatory subunit 16A-like n=1 Tax=Uloborus diversus TaxID=327109 RepID=UPI0024095874|nr:protein phosphatase 1 regulatory subunit 16A-like [Uloborus diversus]
MADHSELVSELPLVEKLSTQERLKHARKRRQQQLKRWQQQQQKEQQRKKQSPEAKAKKKSYKVHFVPSVMLLEAAARNDIEEVRRLLLLGVSPDSTNEDGLTALHQCCIDDSEAMLLLLLDQGADVNAADSERWTPLHAAATCGHLHLVRHLVERGADLLAVNADGNMPYDICEDERTLDYIEAQMAAKGVTQEMIDETRALSERRMLSDLQSLLQDGGDIEYRDHQGATPLHIGAANGYVSVVEFILEHHGSTHVADNDLWQPIHAAACWGHPDVIEMLVMAGADLTAKTKNGETPFDICEDPDLKERILQLKSEIETKRATQPQKLRRSHSHNTRSQSVRRTSIRDKSLISRREAREEARMRHEPPRDQQSGTDEEEEKIQQDMEANEKQCLQTKQPDVEDMVVSQDKDAPQKAKQLSKGPAEDNQEDDDLCKQQHQVVAEDTVIQHSESVKVEIHVTVNTTPNYPSGHGTLADLKKHRADLRSLMLTAPTQPDDKRSHTFTYLYDRPPSPTISLRRFCSDPSEIVGGDVHKQGCCVVM